MEGRYIRSGHPFRTGSEDEGVSRTLDPEDLSESPPLNDHFGDVMKLPSTSSPKRGRRALQKRVISIPIRDPEGSRLKGEGAPPSDSWAWRKYGQKPIKGSPYPRGYYRCSSSKGCPARKQVERSRDDPSMLIVTYSCEHNHPWPALRNSHHYNHHHNGNSKASMDDIPNKSEADISSPDLEPEHDHEPEPEPDVEPEQAQTTKKLTEIKDESPELMLVDDEFGWFAGMETTTSSLLQSPFFESKIADETDTDMAMFFPMREEDESLYADLGELPECSVVFRHRDVGTQVQIF